MLDRCKVIHHIKKKGRRQEVRNDRVISVLNSITKLYDLVMCARLDNWFTTYRQQAEGHIGRECIEHIFRGSCRTGKVESKGT